MAVGADRSLDQDPINDLVAAYDSGWNGLEQSDKNGPDDILKIQRLALNGAIGNEIEGPAAVSFTNGCVEQLAILPHIDPLKAKTFVAQFGSLSPTEYQNVVADPPTYSSSTALIPSTGLYTGTTRTS